MKLGGNIPKEGVEFIMTKRALLVAVTIACVSFTGMKVPLRKGPIPDPDVLRDVSYGADAEESKYKRD